MKKQRERRFEMLLIERCGTSLVISLNRPEAGNSVNGSVAKAFEEAIVQVAGDESLCCVIITGSGDKFFCTGGDIKEYRSVKGRDQLDAVMGLHPSCFVWVGGSRHPGDYGHQRLLPRRRF